MVQHSKRFQGGARCEPRETYEAYARLQRNGGVNRPGGPERLTKVEPEFAPLCRDANRL